MSKDKKDKDPLIEALEDQGDRVGTKPKPITPKGK